MTPVFKNVRHPFDSGGYNPTYLKDEECSGNIFTAYSEVSNYISEGSVSHIYSVWPDFLLKTANLTFINWFVPHPWTWFQFPINTSLRMPDFFLAKTCVEVRRSICLASVTRVITATAAAEVATARW